MTAFFNELLRITCAWVTETLLCADQLTTLQLFFLAVVFHLSARHISRDRPHNFEVLLPMSVLPLYFLYRFPNDKQDLYHLVVLLIRSLLIYGIVSAIASLAVSVLGMIYVARLNVSLWLNTHWAIPLEQRIAALNEKCRLKFRLSPPPVLTRTEPIRRPPSRAERMRRVAELAQSEFDEEVAVLNAMPLDDDEREILVLQIKQRLLQKLSQLGSA
jgi:hypothetical protein